MLKTTVASCRFCNEHVSYEDQDLTRMRLVHIDRLNHYWKPMGRFRSALWAFLRLRPNLVSGTDYKHPYYSKPIVGSKDVQERTVSSFQLTLEDAQNVTAEAKQRATRLLELFAKARGVTPTVYETVEDGRLVLYVRKGESIVGTNYNNRVYSNILWVEDMLEDDASRRSKI